MLKSAGYEIPKTILVHDFISLNGQKVSKSLGNVIRPSELVKEFGADGVRYYFLRYGPATNDVDITLEKIKTVYNSDLANGLGNLVARIAKLSENYNVTVPVVGNIPFDDFINDDLLYLKPAAALESLWEKLKSLDSIINTEILWENTDKKLNILISLIKEIRQIAVDLRPFLPQTAEKIEKQFKGPKIKSEKPLFPRIK